MKELNKFYDTKKNVWEIKEEGDEIRLLKESVPMIFFMNDSRGKRLMKRKIEELRGLTKKKK